MPILTDAHVLEMSPYQRFHDSTPPPTLSPAHLRTIESALDRVTASGEPAATIAQRETEALSTQHDLERLGITSYPHTFFSVENLAAPHQLPETAEPKNDSAIDATLKVLRAHLADDTSGADPSEARRSAVATLYAHIKSGMEKSETARRQHHELPGRKLFLSALEATREQHGLDSARTVVAGGFGDALRKRRNLQLKAAALQTAGAGAYGASSAGLVTAMYFTGNAMHQADRVTSCLNARISVCPVVPSSASKVGPDPTCVTDLQSKCQTMLHTGSNTLGSNAWEGSMLAMCLMVPAGATTLTMTGLHFTQALASARRAIALERMRSAFTQEALAQTG